MLQQVMTAPGKIEFQEIETPVPKAGEVLIRIMKIGVCGSDIHVWHGKHPFTSYPVTQGHEVSGEIAALGAGVENLEVGQKVTIQPQVVCGKCYPCRHGKYNLCEHLKVMGFQTTGTASEYFAVDASKVTPLPEGMSYDEGAMLEPLAVTVHAAKRAGDIAGKRVCVLGCGPIGILLIQSLKAFGAAEVMATDVSDYRLELAKACGADYVINGKEEDTAARILELTDGRGADLGIETAGSQVTAAQLIRGAKKGSTIVFVGYSASGEMTLPMSLALDKELTFKTVFRYRNIYPKAIEAVSSGRIRVRDIVTDIFRLDEIQHAMDACVRNKADIVKGVVKIV